MTYELEFREVRTYYHRRTIEADSRAEAFRIGAELADSTRFVEAMVGGGSYEDTEFFLSNGWETTDEYGSYFRLSKDDIERYIEE